MTWLAFSPRREKMMESPRSRSRLSLRWPFSQPSKTTVIFWVNSGRLPAAPAAPPFRAPVPGLLQFLQLRGLADQIVAIDNEYAGPYKFMELIKMGSK